MKRGLLFGSLVLSLSLVASVWTYRQSLNRAEPQIAPVTPGSVTTNPFNLSGFTKEGKLKIYLVGPYNLNLTFTYNGSSYQYPIPSGGFAETAFTVKPSDQVNMKVIFATGELAYGWVTTADPAQGFCDGLLDPVEDQIKANGEAIVSTQCWNDDDSGDDNFDDFEIMVVQPAAAASPSPSPSPSASPQPSPTPSPSASPSPAASPLPTPSASPSPSPGPSQPDTGAPTWLTLFLISGITVITIIKIFL